MPEKVETIQVHYIDQSKGKGVFQINASDFDPTVHKHITAKETGASVSDEGDAATRAELVEAAEAKAITVKASMTKADIQALLDLDAKSKQELIDMAKAKGLDATGSKADLVNRLGN